MATTARPASCPTHRVVFQAVEIAITAGTALLGLRALGEQLGNDPALLSLSSVIQLLSVVTFAVPPIVELFVAAAVDTGAVGAGGSYTLDRAFFAPFYNFRPRTATSQGITVGAVLLPGLYTAAVVWRSANSASQGVDVSWLQSAISVYACSFIGLALLLHGLLLHSTTHMKVVLAVGFVFIAGVLFHLLPFAAISTGEANVMWVAGQALPTTGSVLNISQSLKFWWPSELPWSCLSSSSSYLQSFESEECATVLRTAVSHPAMLVAVYVLLQGLVSAAAPYTFTVGENFIVVQALTIAVSSLISSVVTGHDDSVAADMPARFLGLVGPSALSIQQLTARAAISGGLLMAAFMGLSLPSLQKLISSLVGKLRGCCSSTTLQSRFASTSTHSLEQVFSSAVFWILLVLELAGVVVPFLSFCLGQNPLVWIFSYMGSDPYIYPLMGYWTAVIVALIIFYRPAAENPTSSTSTAPSRQQLRAATKQVLSTSSPKPKVPVIILRKFFHGVAVLMLVPSLWVVGDPCFPALAAAVAVAILATVEYCRVCKVDPIWQSIEWYMGRYHDERDRGALTLSHLYLLLGCSLPLWWLLAVVTPRLDGCHEGTTCGVQTLRCCSEEPGPVLRFFGLRDAGPGGSVAFLQAALAVCGLVTVGVADASAAVVGVIWGRHRWFGTSRKSLEGTMAYAVACCMCFGLLWIALALGLGSNPSQPPFHPHHRLLPVPGVIDGNSSDCEYDQLTHEYEPYLVVSWAVLCVVSAILETSTAQLDNFVLPLHFATGVLLLDYFHTTITPVTITSFLE